MKNKKKIKFPISKLFLIFFLLLFSCKETNKKNQFKVDEITRSKDDIFYKFDVFEKLDPPIYSFEDKTLNLTKITKEFFRCRGNSLNPERVDETDKDNIKVYLDCEGSTKHSLPLINGKESVYPILIELLNHIQKKTSKKVIITCGHRCPKHNTYADLLNNAKTSKHLIGAEVDFYVLGFEKNPEKIVDIILDFYKNKYKLNEEMSNFLTYEKITEVSIKPIYNKEIFIKIYQSNEGRDFSNRHPYPYISLQVLYDKNLNEKVSYSWEKANKGYLRW